MEQINRRDLLGRIGEGAVGVLFGCWARPVSGTSKPHWPPHRLTPTPPMGWNSFDCYGCAANERVLKENLEVFAEKLKPFGYEYFVVDNGWFGEYEIPPGEEFPLAKHAAEVRIDEYGRYLPSKVSFPNGLKPIIDRAHKLGVKFGVHMMRGVSRKAVKLNLPIKGTSHRAAEVANTSDTCKWCHYNYGVDMDKPGAQQFYNSVLEKLAEMRVDFVKYDDIVHQPREIEAVAKAIEHCGRQVVFSISPGRLADVANMNIYKKADMLRITADVWDRREDLEKGFVRWEQMQSYGGDGFWLDLDMIPFGHLAVWNPRRPGVTNDKPGQELLGGKGFERMDNFAVEQKQTFMAQRALAASPLFMGGDLPTTDELSFKLITNREMLACNRNGVVGKLIYRQDGLDVWKTPHKTKPDHGWVGIFNRSESAGNFRLKKRNLGLIEGLSYEFYDIWRGRAVKDRGEFDFRIGADGVVFLRYRPAGSPR